MSTDLPEENILREQLSSNLHVDHQWTIAIDSLNDAVSILDTNHKVIKFNKHFQKLVDKQSDEILNSDCWTVVHNLPHQHENCPILNAGKSKQRETMTTQAGQQWFEIIVDPILDEKMDILSYVHTIRDVTPFKTMEEELRLNEERYKILSELTTDSASSALIYPDGRIEREWATLSLFKEYGYSFDDIDTVLKWRSIIVLEDQPIFDQAFQRVKKGEAVNVELRITTKAGDIRWINNSIEVRPTRQPGVARLLSAVKDITARKETERALRESEERFKSIISNASNVAIQIYDLQANVLYWNPAAVKLYDIPAKNAIGKTLDKLILTTEAAINFKQVLEDINITRTSYGPAEWECVLPNGTKKLIYSVIFPLSTVAEETDFVCVDIDITEAKRSEELKLLVEQTEYMSKVKSQFMANLSHEIRNPLNAIIGLSNTLLKSSLNEEQLQFLDSIKVSSSNLLNILNDVLDYSKVEANKMELFKRPFALYDLVNELKQVYQNRFKEKGLSLTFTVDSQLPLWLNTDDVKLKQILSNLLSNAFKFTETGGATVLFILNQKTNDQLTLEIIVRDTGIGIKKEDYGKIFSSFTQLDSSTSKLYAGTGLGLALVKNYVELLSGHVTFSSEYNQGTSFVVTIPVTEADQTTTIQSPKETMVKNTEITALSILLAEDDGINRLYLTNFLKSEGFKVLVAKDGNEAVARFVEGGVDIILMDCQMPRKDGFTACKEIRELEKNMLMKPTPVIALTGYSINEIQEKFSEAGMNAYIIKPINEQELVAKIMEVITT